MRRNFKLPSPRPRKRIFAVRPMLVYALLLMISLQGSPVHAQNSACYGTPFGLVKVGVATKDAVPIDPALKRDVAASLIVQEEPLSDVPKEIARIRRGYISGFTSAYPNAEPEKSWFGIDLDRRAAYVIERYIYDANSPTLREFVKPELNAMTWARKWVSNTTVQIEVVKYLPGNIGATTFSSFVCSANALWASKQVSTHSGFTDALSSYAYIVDISADGRRSYTKQAMPGGAVDDAVSGIRARM
jgi:hypothetical protein